MENLKQMIDVNTIIGDPVETPDGSVILTVSKVGFGFAAGGSEFKGAQGEGGKDKEGGEKEQQGSKLPFGGGSGGGVSITPIAFLIVSPSGVKMLHLDEGTHLFEKLIELAPQAVDKIQQMLKSNSKDKQNQENQDKPKQDFDI